MIAKYVYNHRKKGWSFTNIAQKYEISVFSARRYYSVQKRKEERKEKLRLYLIKNNGDVTKLNPQLLCLSVRVANGLDTAGIKTVGEIIQNWTQAKFCRIKNLGKKSLRELECCLEEVNVYQRGGRYEVQH